MWGGRKGTSALAAPPRPSHFPAPIITPVSQSQRSARRGHSTWQHGSAANGKNPPMGKSRKEGKVPPLRLSGMSRASRLASAQRKGSERQRNSQSEGAGGGRWGDAGRGPGSHGGDAHGSSSAPALILGSLPKQNGPWGVRALFPSAWAEPPGLDFAI